MMNPSAMRRLFPDLDESEWPTYGAMDKDAVYLLPNGKRALPLKPTPPPFRNHGNHVTSVAQLGRWLSQQAEEAGVYILGETSGHKLLVEDGTSWASAPATRAAAATVEELSNFEPGLGPDRQGDRARRGHRRASDRRGDPPLRDRLRGPAAVGARGEGDLGGPEAARPGHPHDGLAAQFAAKYREFGGSFIYPMGEDRVSLGLVVGLDYRDARFSVHDALPTAEVCIRSFAKRSSRAASASAGARRRSRPAATGRGRGRLWAPGVALVGDGAGMVNVPTLKGVHYAMHAGMFAAEAIYERLKGGGDCHRPLELPVQGRGLRDREGPPTARGTCASRSRRASSSAARSRA